MFATSGTSDHSPVVGHQRGGVNAPDIDAKDGHEGLNCPSRTCPTSERPRSNVAGGLLMPWDTSHRGMSVRRVGAH